MNELDLALLVALGGMWLYSLILLVSAILQAYGQRIEQVIERGGSMTDEQIARATHQINKAFCEALGDKSQSDWEYAPEWQRAGVIGGVAFLRANPKAGPKDAHGEWIRKMRAAGWEYGPAKDVKRRHHPNMLPYTQLPREQQAKDILFHTVVRALE